MFFQRGTGNWNSLVYILFLISCTGFLFWTKLCMKGLHSCSMHSDELLQGAWHWEHNQGWLSSESSLYWQVLQISEQVYQHLKVSSVSLNAVSDCSFCATWLCKEINTSHLFVNWESSCGVFFETWKLNAHSTAWYSYRQHGCTTLHHFITYN